MRRSLLSFGALAVSAAFVMLATAAASPAATFTVTTPFADTDDGPGDANPGDGLCANPLGACGIEAAIDEANATPGIDTIAFDLPTSEPVDFFLNLVVTEPVVIDGTTEPDFVGCDAPAVRIDSHADLENPAGIVFTGGGSIVRGIDFRDWLDWGVALSFPSDGNLIECNRFGTGDEDLGINVAISLEGSGNVVQDNVFDWVEEPVRISGPSATGNVVRANTMTVVDTAVTIWNGASDNTIGGTGAGDGNTIAGVIWDNIDYSGGIWVRGGTGNAILGNSIRNGPEPLDDHLGIELGAEEGVTLNDPLDADSGPNELQNFPVLASADVAGGATHVTGQLSSVASTSYRVELFSSGSCDVAGHGPGETYLGFTTVATDAAGDGPIDVTLPAVGPGSVLTATATDPDGNTSEFSACLPVILTDDDADDDGVADGIDSGGLPGTFADPTLTPATTGRIMDGGGLDVRVEDASDPDKGVTISVGAGSGEATISVCGFSELLLPAGSQVTVTCSSVIVDVIAGEARLELGDGFTVVSIPQGASAEITDNGDGTASVENLGGGDVLISVGGIESSIGPGEVLQPPVAALAADAGGPYQVVEGSSLQLTGSASGGVQPYSFAWSGASLTDPGTATPSFSGTDDGTVSLSLLATDAFGLSDSADTQVTVTNANPVLDRPQLDPGSSVSAGVEITATAAFTDTGPEDTHVATIDWDDGAVSSGQVDETDGSGTASGTHSYTTAGTYTVTVTVLDDDGGQAQGNVEIVVGPPAGPCSGEAPPDRAIVGTTGNDLLRGTPGDDIIWGLAGNDWIDGRGGDDTICAGAGNDIAIGGDGNDALSGGNGVDGLEGGAGDDTLGGGAGLDVADGGAGDDYLDGGQGRDRATGGTGNDTCTNAEVRRTCEIVS